MFVNTTFNSLTIKSKYQNDDLFLPGISDKNVTLIHATSMVAIPIPDYSK
ncbi:hypothetical protein L3i20_v217930 [Paenibacillus sp. L3-i20]|nr:hypothetical protein L3i20_v217930 [Paenibacillus sp. L3-i20]